MTIQVMQAVVLICDGCKTEVGPTGEYRSATEARAAAYGLGWRFPAKINAQGRESSRTNDVCPTCIKEWTPQTNAYDGSRSYDSQYRRVSEAT